MNPDQINEALLERGFSHEKICRRLRISATSKSVVSHVIHGRGRSRRVEAAISRVTGIPLTQLWPDWYPETESAA